MTTVSESFPAASRFYDDDNFPYGFDRSGLFTRTEVEILESCGRTLKALHNKTLQPNNSKQLAFLAMCDGLKQAESPVEKVWEKYCQRVGKPFRPISLYQGAEPAVEASTDAVLD